VLCELRGVFGGIVKRKNMNVLVTRCWFDDIDVSNDMNHQVNAIKKVMALNKIEVTKGVKKLHREVTTQNTVIQIQLDAMERSVRDGIAERASMQLTGGEEQELIKQEQFKE
jgi:hypothetical protein